MGFVPPKPAKIPKIGEPYTSEYKGLESKRIRELSDSGNYSYYSQSTDKEYFTSLLKYMTFSSIFGD